MIAYNRQPIAKTAYNPVLPRPNFLFNAAAGPFDLITGNTFQTVSGAPLAHNTEKGFGYKSWEATCPMVPDVSPTFPRQAFLAVFYVTNPATNGAIIAATGGVSGTSLRLVSGVLQYVPTSNITPTLVSTATISAGKTYVVFAYTTATGTADRHIWVDGINTDGASSGSSSGSVTLDSIRFGQSHVSATSVPDVTLLAGAFWTRRVFTETMAYFISNNPWSIFKKPNTHALALPGQGTTRNLLRGNFSKLLGGKL